MKRRIVTGLLAAGLMIGGAAQARAKPCDAGDIVGVWSLATIDADEPGVEEFYETIADEWMRFAADGTFIYTASNRPETDLASIQRSLDDADALDRVTYRTRVDGSGRLTITRDGVPFQVFQCDVADSDDGPVMAGDMILSSVPGAPSVRRVQSRLAP